MVGGLNSSGQQSGVNFQNAGNISIKKTTHIGESSSSSDNIESSGSTSVTTVVPSPQKPELTPADANANNKQPNTDPNSPEGNFSKQMNSLISGLSGQQLQQMQGDDPALGDLNQAQNRLIFAFNNPNANVGSATRSIINQMIQTAAQQTRQDLKLSNSWLPPQSNTESAMDNIRQTYDKNFESELDKLTSDPNARAAIRAAHYSPANSKPLSIQLQQFLATAEQSAEAETSEQTGAPASFLEANRGVLFQNEMSFQYDANFRSLVDEQVSGGDLTKEEAMSLIYLHENPDAEVPEKNKLSILLKQLNGEAATETAESMGLEANTEFTPMPTFTNMLNKLFQSKLPPNLQNMNLYGPMALMMAGPQLQQFISEYGLPSNWMPKPVTDDVEEDDVSESEETGGAEEQAEISDASLIGIALTDIEGSSSTAGRGVSAIVLEAIPEPAPRDTNLGDQVVDLYNEYASQLNNFSVEFLLGGENMSMINAMGIVSAALNTIREQNYSNEAGQAEMSQKIANMSKEALQKKINLMQSQEQEMIKQQQSTGGKSNQLFNFLDAVCSWCPGLAKGIEDAIKVVMWAIDVVTGGLVSMICQAIGLNPDQSMTENPLLMAGLITKDQADKMDLALQIVAMVVETAVSIVLAQPELVAGLIADMTSAISEGAAKIAINVSKAVVKEAVEEAVKSGVELSESAVKDLFVSTMKTTMKEAIEEGVEKASVKGFTSSLKQMAKEGMEKAMDEFIDKVASRETRSLMEEFGEDVIKSDEKGIVQGAKESFQQFAEKAWEKVYKLKKALKGGSHADDPLIGAFKHAARRGASGLLIGSSGAGATAYNVISTVIDITSTAVQITGNVLQGYRLLDQANIAKALAQIEGAITETDADMQVLSKAMKQMLTAMQGIAADINAVNQVQADMWKTAQIHFIAA